MAQLEERRKVAAGYEAAIPDKLYFRIGEVASLCRLPAYVLRFWESEFPQLKPNKGGTGQRLYRQRDVRMVLRIKELLYEGGFTIPGARQVLVAEQRKQEPQLALSMGEGEGGQPERKALRQLRSEMVELLEMLGGVAVAPREKVRALRPVRNRATPIATPCHMSVATSQDLFE